MAGLAADERAQGAFEYVLLIGGAILFVLLVIAILRTGLFSEASSQTGNRTLDYYAFLNATEANLTSGT